MTNRDIVLDEMFASVIDGVATQEERRLVYEIIEKDDELKQAFMDCMYLKVFEEEIEADFQKRYADQIFELNQSAEIPAQSGIFKGVQLSVNNFENESKKKS